MFKRVSVAGKQRGFTLVEVLTVMLVLVAVASITVEVSSDLAFQNRYEITKDRYEKIKRAIIGRPDVLINGQPDISGFVADMGRLPRNIHELLEEDYCLTDRTIHDETTCTTANWVDQTARVSATSTTLGYGWNGPYLDIFKIPEDVGAIPDGWGTLAQNDADHNYGWGYCLGDTVDFSADPDTCSTIGTELDQALAIKSYGKDRIDDHTTAPSDIYDADYPEPTVSGVTVDWIDTHDWQIDISGGINVQFVPSYTPASTSCIVEDTTVCSAVSSWTGGTCSDVTYTNKTNCIANSGTWTDCDTSSPSSKNFCENNGGVWAFNTQNICMLISFRTVNSGATVINDPAQSSIVTVTENGREQILHFGSFINSSGAVTHIPMGINAIGIYEHDGVNCDISSIYPSGSQVIKLAFIPHISLPTINW